ncbi:hypothetical protein [Bdellovibrio sp. GT3]|uniref:hypothetical protein n=1 Tax=Bdellovibrio sp. GT3 TaxID=3136282 RepID=UPI0030F3FC3D
MKFEKGPSYKPMQMPIYREKRLLLFIPSALLLIAALAIVTLCPVKDSKDSVRIFANQSKKPKTAIAQNIKPHRSPSSMAK